MPQSPSAQPERRTYRRVLLRLPLQYRRQGSDDAWRSGTTNDLSAVGLLFTCQEASPLGTPLSLLIRLPEDAQARELTGTVARAETRDGADGFLIGVTFGELRESERAHLAMVLHGSDIIELLRESVTMNASDVHLSAHHPPIIRVAGVLRPQRKSPISGDDLKAMIYTILDEPQRRTFERDLELNYSMSIDPTVRFRVNVHSQRGQVEATFRRILPVVRTLAELNLPTILEQFGNYPDGLVLMTGRTGAGKTTTLAAIVDRINATRTSVIITLENPIEYVYAYKKSLIKQREIGVDTRSFDAGLREAMRQNPDVIVVGEVRDDETVKGLLEAAESGHLVLATMPAGDCQHALSRLISFYPKERQGEARNHLATCLRAVVSQRLIPRSDIEGVVPATEILVNTEAVSNLIRSGGFEQIGSVIQVSSKQGMVSFDGSLLKLHKRGLISYETLERHRQRFVDVAGVAGDH